jgi:hypothetical protein
VIGRVAEEDAVEKAVSIAGAIALKNLDGESLPINFNSKGNIINT